MDNLSDFLEREYSINEEGKYPFEQVASDIVNLLNDDENSYFEITGFAKDFYLNASLTQDEKKQFYNELKTRNFFQNLNTHLYSNSFAIRSWTIYTIGKFSNSENAVYLERAYEKSFILTNPILMYRCLSELEWLNSKKIENYLVHLEDDNSIISKLVLLYYWEIRSYSPEFKTLLTDKDLISFIVPNKVLIDVEVEISDRLFAFENYISELYNTLKHSFDKKEFQSIAEKFFRNYVELTDTQADKDHQDFLKQLNVD